MEYLAPGVFVEETSFRTKSIEGVSTSTAGFVGRAQDGPAGTPTLVTSFADFQRIFGKPYPSPTFAAIHLGEYLGHAVRAFFANGGRRAWIVRVLGPGSQASKQEANHGVILGVRRTVPEGQTVIATDSLRGVGTTASTDDVRIHWRSSPSAAFTSFTRTVTSYNTVAGTITLNTATPTGAVLRPGHCYIELVNVPPTSASDPTRRPTFEARHAGEAGDHLRIRIRPADRPPVRITQNVTATGNRTISLATVSGFYTGAIVEIDNGDLRVYGQVESIDADPSARTIDVTNDAGTADLTTLGLPGDITAATTDAFVRVLEFDLDILRDGAVVESFTGLSWNPNATADSFARYYASLLNDATRGSRIIRVIPPSTPARPLAADAPLTFDPATPGANPFQLQLLGGSGGGALTPALLAGTDGGPGARTGVEALKERDDISMVAVPGVTDEFVQSQLLLHCELDKYRVAVLDGVPNQPDVAQIEVHRNAYDSKYGAYYTPWLQAIDVDTGNQLTVPPSGHVMGIYARTDNERGVHKAPANEVVRGITGVELPFSTGEQEVLNPQGVNLIREFTGRGIRLWGARTVSSDSEWKYVSTRRYFVYLEASIDRGTQWVVFEPNGPKLWDRVTKTIESFLGTEWRAGRLMGTKTDEAFFVRCDRTTMTQNDIDNGRLICEIGVAPLYPAEFVIFRIGQFTANAEV